MNTFDAYGFVEKVIRSLLSLTQVLFDFLSMEVNIGGSTISMWGILAGAGFIAVLLFRLVI